MGLPRSVGVRVLDAVLTLLDARASSRFRVVSTGGLGYRNASSLPLPFYPWKFRSYSDSVLVYLGTRWWSHWLGDADGISASARSIRSPECGNRGVVDIP